MSLSHPEVRKAHDISNYSFYMHTLPPPATLRSRIIMRLHNKLNCFITILFSFRLQIYTFQVKQTNKLLLFLPYKWQFYTKRPFISINHYFLWPNHSMDYYHFALNNLGEIFSENHPHLTFLLDVPCFN